ncbi:MAG: hypothetical protein FGM24_02220 [Candidatus Kapabacteria bacterium]|nr:hypothetical protein [Candidatus Kapabacteria bacterium]
MTQLETLSSVQGRALLRDIYRELRFERQLSGVATLRICWQICTRERELVRLTKRDVVVLHPLGVWNGTSLWMQEIVNRYFYAAINAFVYLGAALLLVAVGLNRTRVIDSPIIVVVGVILEAVLLIALFTVMFFTPADEPDELLAKGEGPGAMTDELLRELGEIGRDYAAMAVQLETIGSALLDVVERQDTLIRAVRESVDTAVSAVAPNPGLMTSMQETTAALASLSQSVSSLDERLRSVERQEVERLVRVELERILSRTIIDNANAPSSPTSR